MLTIDFMDGEKLQVKGGADTATTIVRELKRGVTTTVETPAGMKVIIFGTTVSRIWINSDS